MIKKMIIPDDTSIEDDVITCGNDMIIGSYSEIDLGLIGENIFIGDMVDIKGGIRAYNDLRVGYFSILSGDAYIGGDVYLADRTKINGKLVLDGNLNIGDDVRIDGGFESKGWIIIRDPIPFILFIFLYLSVLLRIGRKNDSINLVLNSTLDESKSDVAESSSIYYSDDTIHKEDLEDVASITIDDGSRLDIFLCPESTYIGDRKMIVDTPLDIGERCIVRCSIDAYDILIEKGSIIDGDLVSRKDIFIGEDSEVRGNIRASGKVTVDKNATILGRIKAKEIFINPDLD